jgi:hypothetical protein
MFVEELYVSPNKKKWISKSVRLKMQPLTKVTLPEPPVDVLIKVDALDIIFVEKHGQKVAGGGLKLAEG